MTPNEPPELDPAQVAALLRIYENEGKAERQPNARYQVFATSKVTGVRLVGFAPGRQIHADDILYLIKVGYVAFDTHPTRYATAWLTDAGRDRAKQEQQKRLTARHE